jgi:hypothetical protein
VHACIESRSGSMQHRKYSNSLQLIVPTIYCVALCFVSCCRQPGVRCICVVIAWSVHADASELVHWLVDLVTIINLAIERTWHFPGHARFYRCRTPIYDHNSKPMDQQAVKTDTVLDVLTHKLGNGQAICLSVKLEQMEITTNRTDSLQFE